MKTPLRSLLFAALAITGAGAFAADRTSVRIINDGVSESLEVPFDELKVGESRQLAAASGTPAIVTRTDSGLSIEMGGRTTEIRIPHEGRHLALLGDDGEHRIKVLHREHAETHADGVKRVHVLKHGHGDGEAIALGQGEAKIIVRHRKDGDGANAEFDDAELEALLAEAGVEGGDGKQIVVVRRSKTEAAADD